MLDVLREGFGNAVDEVLVSMSDGLRSPLNSILMISEILQEGMYGPLTGRQSQALRNLDASAWQLLRLIDTLLDLAYIENGELAMDLQPIPVDLVCRTSLLSVSELAHSSRVRITYTTNQEGAELRADPRRFKQMLAFLLRGAVEATGLGGTVTLAVTVMPEQQLICFAAEHSDNGITAAEASKLYRPFTLLDMNLEGYSEETRLGLVLVKRLAEQHGGNVMIESIEVPLSGQCLSICLPYRL